MWKIGIKLFICKVTEDILIINIEQVSISLRQYNIYVIFVILIFNEPVYDYYVVFNDR